MYNMEPEEIAEKLNYIQYAKEGYESKVLTLKKAKEAIALMIDSIVSKMTEAERLDGRNIAAFLKVQKQLPPSLRVPYGNKVVTTPFAIDIKSLTIQISQDVKNPEALRGMLDSVIAGVKEKKVGNALEKFYASPMNIEKALDLIGPIQKTYLGKDELRPVMSGVAFMESGALAMTDAHALLELKMSEFDPVFPIVSAKAVNSGRGIEVISDLSEKRMLTKEQQIAEGKGFAEYERLIMVPMNAPHRQYRSQPLQVIEGKYPSYEAVIPSAGKRYARRLLMDDAKELYALLMALQIFPTNLDEDLDPCAFIYTDDKGEKVVIGYSLKRMIEQLEAILYLGPNYVSLETESGNRATAFRMNTRTRSGVYIEAGVSLIMPMRIGTEYEMKPDYKPFLYGGRTMEKGGVIDEVEFVRTLEPKALTPTPNAIAMEVIKRYPLEEAKGHVIIVHLNQRLEILGTTKHDPTDYKSMFEAVATYAPVAIVTVDMTLRDTQGDAKNKLEPILKPTGISVLDNIYLTEFGSLFSDGNRVATYETGGHIDYPTDFAQKRHESDHGRKRCEDSRRILGHRADADPRADDCHVLQRRSRGKVHLLPHAGKPKLYCCRCRNDSWHSSTQKAALRHPSPQSPERQQDA